ncbi:hypothetical protein ILUMI_26579 [Ignelater luminosus]|uniref:Protein sleepless n=1 Tax=Ignelater luminosus TaxID=2038154 RepID=A0A8K0FXC1_IGNLU|nr:hypothetical protein ILUMI_26579 [Ignelater luminosus]
MYIKTTLVLVAFLVGINLSVAIKCYTCAGSGNSDCAKGKISSMSIVNCKAPGVGHSRHRMYSHLDYPSFNETLAEDTKILPVCLKFDDADYEPRLFARACGLFPLGMDPCGYLEQHANILNCAYCKTDLCNQKVKYYEDDVYVNIIED